MVFSKESSSDSNGFVRHEIKTYQRKGDQVRSEFERLNPDGSVTKCVAYGDVNEGLRYKTFHLGLDGAVREIVTESSSPHAVASQATPQAAPQVTQHRKIYAFIVEPKTNSGTSHETADQTTTSWRIRPVSLSHGRSSEPTEQSIQQKATPSWYEPLKEVYNEAPREDRPEQRPPPSSPETTVSRLFKRFFDDDLFYQKPVKTTYSRRTSFFESFNLLEDSLFDRSLKSMFPLLADF